MTQANKLKQKIRSRAKKTGESYSTARRHVLNETDKKRTDRTKAAASKARTAKATGTVSEARCIEKTGHGFDHWFGVLDKFKAPDKGHKAAAKHLLDDHKVSAWYAQSITVAYERARGLRDVNQSCSGDFQVSVSRVLPVSLDAATDAIGQKRRRQLWSAEVESTVRDDLDKALGEKRIKRGPNAHALRYKTKDGTVEWRLTAKDDAKSQLVVTASGLASRDAIEPQRARWKATLDRFRDGLKS